jgi:AGCS family alanine or glycine:cation symporter
MNINFKIILVSFNEFFTFYLVFPAIVLLGLFLTIRLRGLQMTKLKMSFACLLNKESGSQGNMSHYQAIASVLAGNFGTGNISGMAIAISTGGPGALVWMWMMAFLGTAIQYASCVLGIKYRRQNSKGEYVSGPMYYLRDGLGFKRLGVLFGIFTIFGALTVGNFVQINSVTLPLQKMGFHPFVCGLVLAFLVGIVLLGGIQRVAKIASFIVPV